MQPLQTQRTHHGHGLKVGIKAHQHCIVMQSHGGHQQVEAQHRAADGTAVLAQDNRLPPEVWRRGQGWQCGELGL